MLGGRSGHLVEVVMGVGLMYTLEPAMGSRFHMLCYAIVGMGLSWVSMVPKIGTLW